MLNTVHNLIRSFRRLQVKNIILLFFLYAEIVAKVQPEAARISLSHTAGTDTSLVDGEFVVVCVKDIIGTQCDDELFLQELL